jgi:hypothetical protein
MNSLNCLVKFPVSCGGLFFGMRKRTLIGCISELGGSPFANSMAVIPENKNKNILKIKIYYRVTIVVTRKFEVLPLFTEKSFKKLL